MVQMLHSILESFISFFFFYIFRRNRRLLHWPSNDNKTISLKPLVVKRTRSLQRKFPLLPPIKSGPCRVIWIKNGRRRIKIRRTYYPTKKKNLKFWFENKLWSSPYNIIQHIYFIRISILPHCDISSKKDLNDFYNIVDLYSTVNFSRFVFRNFQ